MISDNTAGAINAAEIGKRAVENNSLLVDQFRAAKKADAESWKQNVRDIFGEGATSQLINGAINVIEETSDGALFLIDGGFDTLATITTCAVKDSYCDQAKQDLSSKNQVISDAVNSLMNGSYWNAIQTTAIQAYQGDQKALEDISGLIIGVLTPTVKGISKKGTLDNFAYRVPEPLDSTKNLPVVGESVGYKHGAWNINIKGDIIYGRKYSAHALERMAPNTLEVIAELSSRAHDLAIKQGLIPGTKEYYTLVNKYVDPRNIPPLVVEDAIKNGTKVIGRNNTFIYESNRVKVITNNNGDVITVIPR